MPSLAITTLALSHFRSHKASRIEADGRPLALYGSNGAGKTNILEAVSLLSPGRGLRRAGADEIARAPERLGWKVAARLESLHQSHEIEIRAEAGAASRAVGIDGKPAPQTALGRVARILWLVPAMDRLWLEGAAERRRFLDRMAMSLEPAHADAALAYEKAMRQRNGLLKEQSRDESWYGGLEAQMAAHGAAIIANRRSTLVRLRAAQESAETAFPRAGLEIVMAEGADPAESEEELRYAFETGRFRDMAAGRTLSGPHRADLAVTYAAKGVAARDASTGEQKALLISLVLANARAIAQDFGAAPILLLDEVAAHLDEGRRAHLYDEICTLGAQAWMTGTGAELFAPLGGRAQWFAVSEAAGLSTVEPLSGPPPEA